MRVSCLRIDRKSRAGRLSVPGPDVLAPVVVILTKLMDFIVIAEVAMVAVFPNVAGAGIEECMVTAAVRELNTGEASLRHGRPGVE